MTMLRHTVASIMLEDFLLSTRIDPLFFLNRHGIANYYPGERHPSTEGSVDNGSKEDLMILFLLSMAVRFQNLEAQDSVEKRNQSQKETQAYHRLCVSNDSALPIPPQ